MWAKKLNFNGSGLIAGYGIWWNIKFESLDRGYNARNVINKMLENERDQQEKEGGKNVYNDYEITCGDWEIVKKLNDILSISFSWWLSDLPFSVVTDINIYFFHRHQEFYYLTKKMEGDIPSASMMLAEYWYIKEYLKKKLASDITKPKFKPIFRKMISKTTTYLNEDLGCDAILIATALNPCYQISLI